MKTIPPDVQKAITQATPTTVPVITTTFATISAVLHIPILMYHYVEYVQDKRDTERQKLNVTPYVLEQQIQTLIATNTIPLLLQKTWVT